MFLIDMISASRTCDYFFFFFLVSCFSNKHHHVNRLHLFWDSLEWFCLQISSDAKYCSRHCNQGLITVILYNFQIWSKKEHNVIISQIINCHMCIMYIDTHYIIIKNVILFIFNVCSPTRRRILDFTFKLISKREDWNNVSNFSVSEYSASYQVLEW